MNFLTQQSSISPGEIRFFDAIEPPLLAGEYTLSAQQQINNVPNPGGPATPQYLSDQTILVTGPQFAIGPTVIHSQYPAPLTTGEYSAALPNVVLTDFALPWSRPIDPLQPDANPNVPWMGLLTLYPGEIQPGGTSITANNKVIGPKSVTISELITPTEQDVQGPALDAADIGVSMNTPVTVVDMDFATFQAISPRLEEVPFLAHGREVNTDGKVMLGMDADGYFSLLIGNRFPQAGTDDTPAENHVFLVSFEGHSAYLRGGQAPPKAQIRLVLLASWKFMASAAVSSFLSEMADLCLPNHGGVQLMQMPGDLNGVQIDTAREALQIGYTALQNDMRVGEKATSWYRGPLVPAPTKRDFTYGPYLYSDHAMHYDPSTGIFDHSYSAAWQIGRLLALSDAHFARAFFTWRNNYINEVNQQAASAELDANVAKLMGEGADQVPNGTGGLPGGVQLLLARGMKKAQWPLFTPRGEAMLGDHLPGVLSREERQQLLERDEDPLIAILKK